MLAQEKEQGAAGASLGTSALLGLGFLILTALLTVVLVVQQRASGAFAAEFSATTVAEAPHVVTGILVARYLEAGFPPLLAFAGEFAQRLPAVMLGPWPPLYYSVLGLWLSALDASTPAVLLLLAVQTALLVASAGWAAARILGPLPAVAVGAVLMALPLVRAASLVVGLDLPLALVMLWAGYAWSAVLAKGRCREALLFGLLAAAAALTQPTGGVVLLVPALTVLLTGRFDLLRRGVFWGPLVLAGALSAPWYLATWPLAGEGFARATGAGPAGVAAALVNGLGTVLAILAAAGAVQAVAAARSGRSPLQTTLVALAIAWFGTLAVLAPADPAALLPLIVPAVMLAASGGVALLGLLTSGWTTLRGLTVMLVMLLAAMPALLTPVLKPALGVDAVAQTFLAEADAPRALLVVADPAGEAALIAAIAQRARGFDTAVVPARMAAAGAPPATPEEWLSALDRRGIGYLALQSGGAGAVPLSRELEAVTVAHPERTRFIAAFPRGGGGEIRLYAWVAAAVPLAPPPLETSPLAPPTAEQ